MQAEVLGNIPRLYTALADWLAPMMWQYPGILQIQIERRTVGIIVADVFAGIKELIDQTYRIVKMP